MTSKVDNLDHHIERINSLAKSGRFSLLLWPGLLFTSFMAFDAPGAANEWFPWTFGAVVWSLPITIFLVHRLARRALESGRIKTAYCLVVTPTLIMISPMLYPIAALIFALITF